MTETIEKGQVLILTGPPGGGKTRLAIAIAEQYGPFETVFGRDVDSPFVFGAVLAREPATVIIEEPSPKSLDRVTRILGSGTALCYWQYQYPLRVKEPNFIVCWGDGDLKLDPDDRRYRILQVG